MKKFKNPSGQENLDKLRVDIEDLIDTILLLLEEKISNLEKFLLTGEEVSLPENKTPVDLVSNYSNFLEILETGVSEQFAESHSETVKKLKAQLSKLKQRIELEKSL
ncbi:MAG: hypothetical protein AB1721_01210 [Patescibacteria group bacterium]